MNKTPDYLTPEQLVDRWDNAVTTGTLANWRSKKMGPAYQKFGSRVRYPLADILAYEAARKVSHNDNEKGSEE